MKASAFFAWINAIQILILATGNLLAIGPRVRAYETFLGSFGNALQLLLGNSDLKIVILTDANYTILVRDTLILARILPRRPSVFNVLTRFLTNTHVQTYMHIHIRIYICTPAITL